jgi:predicted nuclease of predicted toxin-antitoxin system
MAQTKIIVDTNSYLRLAQNIHPLLGVPFGKKENTLYMHSELNAEFRASSRLQSKFQWACEPDFVDNRRRPLSLSKQQKVEIEDTFEYMWSFVQDEFHRKRQKGPSRTDTKIIATAATLEIRVVTDDQDMIELAEMYGVHHLTSLELLKLMLDENYIDLPMIERIVEQWQYENDTPNAKWKEEYSRLFGHDSPKD